MLQRKAPNQVLFYFYPFLVIFNLLFLEMAWDPTPRVKFTVPFPDVKTDIYLDSVLPRVVEMAEGASERQTKVAACELLHSIVLFIVGTSAHHARRDSSEVHNTTTHHHNNSLFI